MKITLPENTEEITLGKFQRYMRLVDRANELDEYTFLCEKVEIFTGIDKVKVKEVMQKDLEFINNQIDKALSEQGQYKDTFFIKDVEFGRIPNFDKMKSKEYFDLSANGVDIQNLHRVMAVLYRPIINKQFNNYEIADYKGTDEYANIMKQTPLSYVNGVLGFFLTLQQQLNNHIQKYIQEEQAKAMLQQVTLKSGAGMQQLTN